MKNGGSNRLHSLFVYLKNLGKPVKFITYADTILDENTHSILYWKQLRGWKLIICLLYRLLNLFGYACRDWQFCSGVLMAVDEHKPQTVLLSYPTIDSLFLASKLSSRKDLKIVFDYRDGITKNA